MDEIKETKLKDETEYKKSFNRKKNFVFIGNYRHKPNFEAAKMLIYHIWPKIRK